MSVEVKELIKLYDSDSANCCKCGCELEDFTGQGLGSVFILDMDGNFYCCDCDKDFEDGDERIFEKDLVDIRYYICGIGYDADNNVTDYEREFGDFDTLEDAQNKFDEIIENIENNFDEFSFGAERVSVLKIQIEKCVETDDEINCIEVVSETDIGVIIIK